MQTIFGFLIVTFFKKKKEICLHIHVLQPFQRKQYTINFFPYHTCISALFVIMAGWNFIVELVHNLFNHFLIDGHLVSFPQSLIFHVILQ